MRKLSIIALCLLLVIAMSALFTGCTASSVKNLIGTTISLKLEGGGAKKAEREIYEMIGEVEASVSTDFASSIIGRINDAKVGDSVELDDIANTLIGNAYRYYELTDGALDISIFPVVDLWGFSPSKVSNSDKRVPSDEEIEAMRPKIGLSEAFSYDSEKKTITKLIDGAMLDTGAIAKGYIADLAKEILDKNNVKKAIIDIGGTLYLYGDKLFRVGIRNPRMTAGADDIIDVVECENISVSTSGDYERYFIDEATGARYHHIIDPSTLKPAKSGLISVTIISDSAMLADILSTSVLVMGRDAGLALVRNEPTVSQVIMMSEDAGEVKIERFTRGDNL